MLWLLFFGSKKSTSTTFWVESSDLLSHMTTIEWLSSSAVYSFGRGRFFTTLEWLRSSAVNIFEIEPEKKNPEQN